MADRPHIGLDNAAFAGRLRQNRVIISERTPRLSAYALPRPSPSFPIIRKKPDQPAPLIAEVAVVKQKPKPQPVEPVTAPWTPPDTQPVFQLKLPVMAPQPFAEPAAPRPQASTVLRRQFSQKPEPARDRRFWFGLSKLQLLVLSMAGMIFIVGLFVSLQTMYTNHSAAAQISAIAKQANGQAGN